MTTFSIVIPSYNNYHLLHQLLFDIYKKCSLPDEVIISDNCSTELDVVRGIDWWIGTGMLPIKYIKTPQNEGFLKNANYGLKHATGDIVALISTDVRIHLDLVKTSKNIVKDYLVGGRVYWEDTGWNTFERITFPYAEGWLLCASKELWKKAGYFDERFVPNDFEDVDLSTTVISLGHEIIQFTPDMATHLGGRTIGYGAEREEITKRNREKFRAKWIK